MRLSSKVIVAVAPVALLVAGCGSGGSAPTVGGSSKAAAGPSSGPAPTSAATSSSVSPAVTFTKGQKVDPNVLMQAMRSAVIKAGGTYRSTSVASSLSATGMTRMSGKKTDSVVSQDLGGQKTKIIVLDGVGYISGTGMGSTPYIKLTKDSTGPFAQGLKPLLSIAAGGALPNAAGWTVASASAAATVLTFTQNGVAVTQTLNAQNLPVSTVSRSGSETSTQKYFDFGKPVTITAPPASQVTDISLVKMPSN